MNLESYLKKCQREVDRALRGFLPSGSAMPPTIHKAMRHSVFAGGKRLRPVLCLAAAEAVGARAGNALAHACALECIHTYSLIHDDLPCMDDDDFRRGKPTCHKVYGEAVAVLAGDALQAMAFEILAGAAGSARYPVAALVRELAVTSGSRKLIAGQVLDLEGEGALLGVRELKRIHQNKTAALLATSVRLGAMSANVTPRVLAALTEFGTALGLAFQVIDDILDVTQSSERLGKSAGKDVAAQKATYPSTIGLEASRREAARLTRRAEKALAIFGKKGARLREISAYLLERDY
ncbi:MAG: polyprenyl synthetase family protein [Verrucomicrobiales bacterium]